MDYAGDDILDVICVCCGYQCAAPWAAATAPRQTPCPGCGRPGVLTVVAAIVTGGFADWGTVRELDPASIQVLAHDALAAGCSWTLRQAPTISVAAGEVRAQADALRQLARQA